MFRRAGLLLAWALAVAACEFPVYDVDDTPGPDDPTSGGSSAMGGSTAGGPSTPDACLATPCEHEGRCIPVDGSFVCLCAPGFRGDRCELNFDDCDPDPCQNDGVCVDGTDTSFCECLPGWEGATCQLSVNDCANVPCQNSGVCVDGFQSFTCKCQPGFIGDTCQNSLPATCLEVLEADATTSSGVYLVDPDGPGKGQLPLEVLCDMTSMDGGWTLVGQEREGDTGTFKFLGVSVGDPSRAARYGDSALMGERFQGLYEEMRIGWAGSDVGEGAMYFRINEEIFTNTVRQAIPVSDFVTTDATLSGWVGEAGGAILCRGSASPDVRPGDTSWGIEPSSEPKRNCGCSGSGWQGRGGFYGGHLDASSCIPHGGGWSGITDNGVPKADIDVYGLQIWVR